MEIPANLQQPLQNVIKKEGYLKYEVKVQEIGADGSSFLSKTYTVNISGKTADGDKETKIFVKCIIPFESLADVFDLPQAYAAEAFVYNELSQVFEELQDESGIAPSDRLRVIKSYGECNSDVTILENVAVKGYKTCHRTYTMDLVVAEMALKELAKYHALSFVVKAKRPEYYKKKIEVFKHPFKFNKKWESDVQNIAKVATKHVTEATRKRLGIYLKNFSTKWKHYQQDQTSTGSCLCHGDFRLNNILMKHDGDKLEDLYIVDYQLMSFGCPINDFLFFIFTGTDQQFRRQHLDHLRHFYHESFSEFLKKFNLNSEDIYPKREFEKDYRERLDYGLIVALYFMPFFLADEDSIPDLGKDNITDMDIKVLEDFPPRIQGVVDDYVAWGYL
ncbi:ecdysteroid kinase domain-containing protein [Phthorimaea operculella]|nr:ecdysteroid kinase domain-containing protein [Phthorimaea operculella]